MSWFDVDRLTLSQRKLIAAFLGVSWAIFVVVMFGPCDRPEPREVEPSAAGLTQDAEPPSEPVGEPRASLEGEPGGSALMRDATTERARRIATRFVDAYATYSFTDDPGVMQARIEPYVSSSFAAEFRVSSGAAAFYEELESRREHADVVVEGAQTQAVTNDAIEFLVIAKRVVRSTEGREVERPTYLVRVAHTSAGWKVTGLTL